MMLSTVLLEDSITTAPSVLGHPPSMWISKSSFSKTKRCRKSCLVHGGLQATALYAVFTLFNFFKSLSLFIIASFPSLPIRKRKLVLLLVIPCKKRQDCSGHGHRIAPDLSHSHQVPSFCLPEGQAKVVKR